ncbi:MAG: hypothetical protein E7812_10475 [Phenylobacterium sp.]|nr:MAG: hypothetical protein E7812_10475 [Phenylobacterium sp.]
MTETAQLRLAHEALSKAPPAILMFWVVKICATTVGETGGDALSMTLKLGYLVATLIFLAFFAVTMTWQVASKRYQPLTYWLVVVATTTVGTTTSDFIDRTLRAGYVLSSAGLLALVIAVLVAWKLTTGRIAADRITTRTDEVFYWVTILVSNTLGTALGDFSSETLPDLMGRVAQGPAGGWDAWGFELAAAVFAVLIGVVAALHLMKWAPQAVLFWAAYVLTRPLGATLGDTLTKPHALGGLEFGRFLATGVIALAMVVLILLTPRLRRPAGATPEPPGLA